jgi:nucleotide-binding universal stress UspA family protein
MARFEHVLAATDLSAPARHAAGRAASVARTIGATLDLIHVAPTTALDSLQRFKTGLPADLPERWLAESEAALRTLAATLERQHGVAAGVHLATGAQLEEIARLADALPADLVVLGARGNSFLRHLVLGSTAERLLSTAVRPMLIVKQVAQRPYASVLVPVDLSDVSLTALQCAAAVAPGARISVLHVFDSPFEGQLRFAGVGDKVLEEYRSGVRRDAQERMRGLYERAGLTPSEAQPLLVDGDPVRRILEQEQEHDCDLIVVGKRQGRVADLFLGSVTRRVLAESQCDVLVSV